MRYFKTHSSFYEKGHFTPGIKQTSDIAEWPWDEDAGLQFLDSLSAFLAEGQLYHVKRS